jgi:hypothetical protein
MIMLDYTIQSRTKGPDRRSAKRLLWDKYKYNHSSRNLMTQFFVDHPVVHIVIVYAIIYPLISMGCLLGLRLLRLPPEHRSR